MSNQSAPGAYQSRKAAEQKAIAADRARRNAIFEDYRVMLDATFARMAGQKPARRVYLDTIRYNVNTKALYDIAALGRAPHEWQSYKDDSDAAAKAAESSPGSDLGEKR